ncbi:hypothetical protein JCM3775_007205 [Rhodotorula graminis]
MSSPPDSSAAAPVLEPDDPLFRQIGDVYSFFKDPAGATLKRKDCTPEELAHHHVAASLNERAGRGLNSALQSWDQMSQTQHERLVELLLKYYCESRADPKKKEWPISFPQLRNEIGCPSTLPARQPQLPAHVLTPFQRLNMLLGLAVTLYKAPIDGREFRAFEQMRQVIGKRRRQVTRAPSTTPGLLPDAQQAFADAEAVFKTRLHEVNERRVVRLQQVKAAVWLLYNNAALVPGSSNGAHHAAVEVYFSRLDSGQQDAAIAQVREFVFAACEERAVRGEALNPDQHLAEILNALRAHHLGHALCAVPLASIVICLESQDAPSAVVKHFRGVHRQFCSVECTHLFSHLALTQQLHAVVEVRSLLRRVRFETPKAREAVKELDDILPMGSEDSTSWKHALKVDDPPVLLHSLAHSASTRRAPFGADSTSSATSSRYFPQARSAR